MIEKIKYIIEFYNLKTKSREREIVYKRYYIYSELINLKYNLCEIGRMLDKKHTSVLYGIKIDKQFQNFDKIYDDAIEPIKKYLYDPNVTIKVVKYSIFQDVIKCKSKKDLRIIKLRIHDKKYIEQEV
jgi:hypothetical protein